MLLIVMHESGTWRVRPGQVLTFGRARTCSIPLSAGDRGLSRSAGCFRYRGGVWWLHNDSKSSLLYVTGDRGFRVDLPPGMRIPLQQWRAKVRLDGLLDCYTLRLRLPDLDGQPGGAQPDGQPGGAQPDGQPGGAQPGVEQAAATPADGERVVTTTRYRARLTDSDRLVLAARFEQYLTWQFRGAPAPRTAKETGERIGWQPHTVAKRCENIRGRYARLGVPGLRGPRALDELAKLLISTNELTADDLRRLPAEAPQGPRSKGSPIRGAASTPP